MIIKVVPDKEKAKSILRLIEDREEFIGSADIGKKFPTIMAENYYEIIKELATASLLLEGLKAVGENAHKEIIDELLRYKEFSEQEIAVLQDLRIKRNRSMYEGKPINLDFVEQKKAFLALTIGKLKQLIIKKLK